MIDRRKSYKMIVDTETCPLDRTLQQVTPNNMWVYDIGWVITDKKGNIYEKRSFVNKDIYNYETVAMKSSYYAEKLPRYDADIKQGNRILKSFYEIRMQLLKDITEYGIKEVYAYNMRFDYGTLNNTYRWLTKSKYRYFFPKEIQICDIMKMAQDVIKNTSTYQEFCKKNGYLTKNGKIQMKAETVYRYIIKDTNFIESHTGLEDATIESVIMAYCFRKKKKMRKLLFD